MSSEHRVITVFGATGSQGNSVVHALLQSNHPQYHIRTVTRDPTGEKAQQLKRKFKDRVDIIKADLDNEQELRQAVDGAWAVFGLTLPDWKHDSLKELEEGKRLVDAVEKARVQYFIYSSLPYCKEESNGKCSVAHFDQKFQVQQYAKNKKSFKSIFFMPPFYLENLANFHWTSVADDGSLVISVPIGGDVPIAVFDVNDTGAIIRKVLEEPEKWVNQEITSAITEISLNELASKVQSVTGRKTKFVSFSQDQFRQVLSSATELLNMFQWFQQYHYYGKRHPFVARDQLKAPMTSLDEWIKNAQWPVRK